MIEKQLANKIYRLGHIERVLIDRELAPVGLRMNHARVLHYIDQHPGCHQKEVADYLDYQPASLTNLINFLEKRAMLVRKTDPQNGRQKQLFLCQKGKEVTAKTDKIFNNLNELIGDLDPQLEHTLDKKIKYLEELIRK